MLSRTCRYVNNVKAALDKFPELKDLGLVDLNKSVGTSKVPQDIATAIRCVYTSMLTTRCLLLELNVKPLKLTAPLYMSVPT